jgi:hypothetical protein
MFFSGELRRKNKEGLELEQDKLKQNKNKRKRVELSWFVFFLKLFTDKKRYIEEVS